MNFLTHLTRRVRAWLARRWPALAHRPPNRRELALRALQALPTEALSRFRAAHTVGVPVQVLYPNIEAYTARLKEAVRTVSLGNIVEPQWAHVEPAVIMLESWLLSSDDYYLDLSRAIPEWLTQAKALCECLESSDYVSAGLPEHNARMLSRHLDNVRSIAERLTPLLKEHQPP